MNAKQKGARRERQGEGFYEEAGFAVESCMSNQFGDTDFFGLFDLIAIQPSHPIHFVQVKSNAARGIKSMQADIDMMIPLGRSRVFYLVCHDSEGWRLIEVLPSSIETLVDERETDGSMGEDVTAFLSEL